MKVLNPMIITFLLSSPLTGFAQGTETHGGGEDGVFKSIRNEIGAWVEKNQQLHQLREKLGLEGITEKDFEHAYHQAVSAVGEKIIFNHEEISFTDEKGIKNIRVCKNHQEVITCNIEEWHKALEASRYLIVFHEYLA